MNVSKYAKTAASIAGGIIAWGTELAALLTLVPDKRVAGIVAAVLLVVHVAQSFSVWLAVNQSTIDADLVVVQKLVRIIKDWPGTLEELKNVIHHVVATITGQSSAVSDGE